MTFMSWMDYEMVRVIPFKSAPFNSKNHYIRIDYLIYIHLIRSFRFR